jgi:hypothetical protein
MSTSSDDRPSRIGAGRLALQDMRWIGARRSPDRVNDRHPPGCWRAALPPRRASPASVRVEVGVAEPVSEA